MKTKSKLRVLLAFAVLIGAAGCQTIKDEITKNSIKIDTADGAKIFQEQLAKNVAPDAKILRITALPETDGEKIQVIHVYIYDPSSKDEVKMQQINLLSAQMNQTDNRPLLFAMPEGAGGKAESYAQTLDKFDFSQIAATVEKAKAQIPAGYSYFGVGSYDLYAANAKKPHLLTLNTTKSGEGTNSKAGGRIVETTYYEYKYSADGKGNVKFEGAD